MKPNAMIAGSTGLVGSELLKLLSGKDYYETIVLPVRKKTENSAGNIAMHVVDFSDLENFDPGIKIRDLYICLGTTQKKGGGKAGFFKVDHDYVLNIAKWARQSGVERVCLISSIGANPKSSSFYLKTKGKIEQELTALGFSHLCILRPSLLLGKREEYRWAEAISAKVFPLFSFLMVGMLKKYRAVKADKVAAAMFQFTNTMKEPLVIVESDKISDLETTPI
ncbi:MAG: NAD-dependent epimerase/dehydratase family protein [Bacteroidales bacterium]|nr:NAD-dependent epimerase/dehydratase family protein [Bacteroidales bacterium]